ncbi:MAG: glycerol kinase GlpK [Pseudomonadota bacterium]
MPQLLSIDQGTTSSRAIVFDINGEPLASAQKEFTQHYPNPGWVEHDPHEILKTQIDVAEQLLGAGKFDIAALGITNQRETTIVWERSTGQAIYPAIVWQDRRTAETCAALRAAGHEEDVQQITGLLLDPYFSASKIAWILEHVPGARARAERGELACGTIDSWLAWHLSGGDAHVIDVSNASRTMLMDITNARWSEAMLELWSIPWELLPQIVSSSGVCAQSHQLSVDLPIAGIAGDQQAALFGQACFAPGDVKCTYGTGCFMLMNTGNNIKRSQHRLLTSIAWQLDGELEYVLEGSVFMGGATVQWLRDGLKLIDQSAAIEALAAEVEHAGGVVMVPALTGLGAPHWDPNARGLLVGLERSTERAHIARAALDGIAWQVAELGEAMAADAGQPMSLVKVDGGASANNLLMQIQSDVLQCRLARAHNLEATAWGAAALSGLAVGCWQNRSELQASARQATDFVPQKKAEDIAAARRRWQDAVERARNWA